MTTTASPTQTSSRRVILGGLKLLFGLLLLSYLVWMHRRELATLVERPVRWPFLLLSGGMVLGLLYVVFARWWLLIRAQGFELALGRTIRIGFIGYMAQLVMPSAVGGDLVRSVLIAREHERRTMAVTTVWVDRIVGLVGLMALAGLAAVAGLTSGDQQLRPIALWGLSLSLAVFLGFPLLFWRPLYESGLARWLGRLPLVGGLLGELFVTMRTFRDRFSVVALAVLLSLLTHVGFLMALWVGGLAVWEQPLPLAVHYLVTPLGLLFGVLPITPGGLGVTELAVDRLFELAGESGAEALMMILVGRVVQLAINVGAALYLFADLRRAREVVLEARRDDRGAVEGDS